MASGLLLEQMELRELAVPGLADGIFGSNLECSVVEVPDRC